jgi:hypothetical protein
MTLDGPQILQLSGLSVENIRSRNVNFFIRVNDDYIDVDSDSTSSHSAANTLTLIVGTILSAAFAVILIYTYFLRRKVLKKHRMVNVISSTPVIVFPQADLSAIELTTYESIIGRMNRYRKAEATFSTLDLTGTEYIDVESNTNSATHASKSSARGGGFEDAYYDITRGAMTASKATAVVTMDRTNHGSGGTSSTATRGASNFTRAPRLHNSLARDERVIIAPSVSRHSTIDTTNR